jgi:hypothetical protein
VLDRSIVTAAILGPDTSKKQQIEDILKI